jgi:hypothetical protein
MTETKKIFETKEGGDALTNKVGGDALTNKVGGEVVTSKKQGGEPVTSKKQGGEPVTSKKQGGEPVTKDKKDDKSKDKKSKEGDKPKDVTPKPGEFPINTIDLSNTFREWVHQYRSSYVTTHTDLTRKIIDKTKIADTALKLAWARFSQEFIDFLKTRLNDKILMSTGTKLEKSNDDWETSPSSLEMGSERIAKDVEMESKKCEPWTKGNSIEREIGKSGFESVKNELAKRFVEWVDDEGVIDSYIPEDFCGADTFNNDWVKDPYLYTVDGSKREFEPYQHPIIRVLAKYKTQIQNSRGEMIPGTLFEKFLQDNNKGNKGSKSTITKIGIPSLKSPSETWSETIISAGPNRQLCVGLRDSLSSSTGDNDIVRQAITLCNSKNSNWLDKSLEGRVKSKLRIFKENKNIQKKLTEKLKSKKTVKVLKENFEKQNYRKFFDTLTKVKKNNNINEATNTEFEKSFDVIFKGKENDFKNRAIEYILNKLEVSPTSKLGMNIKSELDSIPAKDMFKNEYDVPEAVSKAVELSSQSNTEEQNGFKNIVSQSIRFDDKHLKKGVRQLLHDYIEGVKDDIKSLEQKLKSSIMKDI